MRIVKRAYELRAICTIDATINANGIVHAAGHQIIMFPQTHAQRPGDMVADSLGTSNFKPTRPGQAHSRERGAEAQRTGSPKCRKTSGPAAKSATLPAPEPQLLAHLHHKRGSDNRADVHTQGRASEKVRTQNTRLKHNERPLGPKHAATGHSKPGAAPLHVELPEVKRD